MTRSRNSRRGAAPKGKRGYDFGSARLFGWHEATSYNKFRTHRLERRANRQAPERELAEWDGPVLSIDDVLPEPKRERLLMFTWDGEETFESWDGWRVA